MGKEKHSGDAGAGHELSDLQPRTIAIFGLTLAVVVVACLIAAAWLFGFFAARRTQEDVLPSPLARVEPLAAPVLQVQAPNDLEEIRAHENEALNSYGWIDKGAGIVRIPIEEAMQLLTERGLPAAGGTSPPAKAKRR